jgi:hypothetical protein
MFPSPGVVGPAWGSPQLPTRRKAELFSVLNSLGPTMRPHAAWTAARGLPPKGLVTGSAWAKGKVADRILAGTGFLNCVLFIVILAGLAPFAVPAQSLREYAGAASCERVSGATGQ